MLRLRIILEIKKEEEVKRSVKHIDASQGIYQLCVSSQKLMNKSICPLCGKPNDCYMENSKDPKDCWCKDVIIPKGIFSLVPEEALHKACICKACILEFKESKESKESHLSESTN